MIGLDVPRWIRVLAGAVFTVAALAGTLAVREAMPTYEERYRPLGDHGAMGEKLGTLDFTFTGDKVVLAKSLRTVPDGGLTGDENPPKKVFRTDLVWVVVHGRTTATRRDLSYKVDGARAITADEVEIRTGSASFVPPADTGDQVPLGPAARVTYVFDVPPEDLDGLRMSLTNPELVDEEFTGLPWSDARLTPGVMVDLGLDGESIRDARDLYELPAY